ncbi:MAG: hypothetical protein KBA75_02540 [Alphaproteobacteria bacterium]|nr:hypothetical protein [Alphaproteobacteria bacterium]
MASQNAPHLAEVLQPARANPSPSTLRRDGSIRAVTLKQAAIKAEPTLT